MRRFTAIVGAALAAYMLGCGGNGVVSQPNRFEGNYGGEYWGSESGIILAAVSRSGRVSGVAESPSCGDMSLTGLVKPNGEVTASTKCASWIITYTGAFVSEGDGIARPTATASGTWSSTSGYHGSWRLWQQPTPPTAALE